MTKMGKKLSAVLMALAIVVTLLPAIGVQEVYAANFPEEITVGYRDSGGTSHGVRLSAEKPYFVNGNPEAQATVVNDNYNAWYDAGKHELVLKDYIGTGVDERSGSGNLKIFLLGDNKIVSNGNNAINVPGSLEIISFDSAKLTIENTYSTGSSYGIRASGAISLTGNGTIDITSITTNAGAASDAYGISCSTGNVIIGDQVKLTIACSACRDNGNARGIYAHTGNIDICTGQPVELTLVETGLYSNAHGIEANGGTVTIDCTPSITMDLTATDNIHPLLPSSAEGALSDNDYGYTAVGSEGHLSYTIAPKQFVPKTVDIKFDRTNLQKLTVDLTGTDVAAYFFPSITSPNGETCPTSTLEGWYVKLGSVTGFCDDTGDPRDMETSTESLEWGQPYFFCFEVLTDTAHKWNPDQDFSINGSDDVIISEYEADGKPAYQVSLQMVCEDNLNKAQMEEVSDTVYSGSPYTPAPTLTYYGEKLAKDDHYTITYEDDKGNAVASPTDKGNYKLIATGGYCFYGTLEAGFAITEKEIPQDAVTGVKDKAYTGKPITQSPVIKVDGKTLTNGKDYSLSYDNNVNVGTASVTFTGKGNYTGTVQRTFKITKAANPLNVQVKTAKIKYKKLKKKAQTLDITKVIKFAKQGQGQMSYKLVSAKKGKKSYKKYFKVNAKTGKVKVKKKLKKGTYKVEVNVTAAGNANYNPATKAVIFKVKVK